MALTDVKEKLAAVGFAPIGDTPAEFTTFLRSENGKWAKVISEAGIKLP